MYYYPSYIYPYSIPVNNVALANVYNTSLNSMSDYIDRLYYYPNHYYGHHHGYHHGYHHYPHYGWGWRGRHGC